MPDGCDLIVDRELIRREFPYLTPQTIALLHVRRCGWMSAQQLGMYLLEGARAAGTEVIRGRVAEVTVANGGVRSVNVEVASGGRRRIATPVFVNAAGPYLSDVARLVGIELPVWCERHVKLAFNDAHGAIGRDAPLIIWTDPLQLPWSDDEAAELAAHASTRYLTEPFPAGVHGRPEGRGRNVLLYWTYESAPVDVEFPITWSPHMPEIVLRGMSAMVPALRAYFGRLPKPFVDGGYYTKTRENRPLIGPLPVTGAFAMGAFSGYGIMAALGAGELLAAHVTEAALPAYANAFTPARYDDPAYLRLLETWPSSGQL